MKKSLQEGIDRMKYVTKYKINESPVYKNLVGDSKMDTLPEYLMREDEKTPPQGQQPNPGAGVPATPVPAGLPDPTAGGAPADPTAGAAPMPPIGGGAAPGGAPQPASLPPVNPSGVQSGTENDTNVDISTAPSEQMPSDEPTDIAPVESPEKKVMQLQLDALRQMSEKMEDLGSALDSLNQRMEVYSKDVEEVREPSDMEKFENRKVDSSPYYYNLNDLWDNNNFKARLDQFSKGYVKTEDGYVADFDDLPKLAPHEVKASLDPF